MNAAAQEAVDGLGQSGELEVFQHMKRLVHQIGFRCWVGREAASPRYFSRLVELFERLDPEEAFVHPTRMLRTIATRKAAERRALRSAQAILAEIWSERQRRGVREDDMLEQLHAAYGDAPADARHARAAKDVMVLHLASQTNLYAAMAWTLINVLRHAEHRRAVEAECAAVNGGLRDARGLATLTRLEQCTYESVRLAQRSLTLRKVLQPCRVDTGATTYTLQPGTYLATLLSVTNSAYPTLDTFDPAHYERGRIADAVALPAKEVVRHVRSRTPCLCRRTLRHGRDQDRRRASSARIGADAALRCPGAAAGADGRRGTGSRPLRDRVPTAVDAAVSSGRTPGRACLLPNRGFRLRCYDASNVAARPHSSPQRPSAATRRPGALRARRAGSRLSVPASRTGRRRASGARAAGLHGQRFLHPRAAPFPARQGISRPRLEARTQPRAERSS